jgi:6-phosphogluconolactonase
MGNFITAFHWDAGKGTLTPFQDIPTLPADFKGVSTCAEIMMTPDGKFLYASNRGHDSIAQFAVDGLSGKLSLIGITPSGGNTPRNFDFDATHRWLLVTNHASGNAVVFKVDRAIGILTQNGSPTPVTLPFCPRFFTPRAQ